MPKHERPGATNGMHAGDEITLAPAPPPRFVQASTTSAALGRMLANPKTQYHRQEELGRGAGATVSRVYIIDPDAGKRMDVAAKYLRFPNTGGLCGIAANGKSREVILKQPKTARHQTKLDRDDAVVASAVRMTEPDEGEGIGVAVEVPRFSIVGVSGCALADEEPREVAMLTKLQRHPDFPADKISRLLAVQNDALYFPYYAHGSLEKYKDFLRAEINSSCPRRALLAVRYILIQVRRIIDVLEFLHNLEVFHGDLTIENILIDDKGNWVVSDFGLAAQLAEFIGKGVIFGKRKAVDPAMVLRVDDYDYRQTDLWGLAVLLKEILGIPFSVAESDIELVEWAETLYAEIDSESRWEDVLRRATILCCLYNFMKPNESLKVLADLIYSSVDKRSSLSVLKSWVDLFLAKSPIIRADQEAMFVTRMINGEPMPIALSSVSMLLGNLSFRLPVTPISVESGSVAVSDDAPASGCGNATSGVVFFSPPAVRDGGLSDDVTQRPASRRSLQ